MTHSHHTQLATYGSAFDMYFETPRTNLKKKT